MNDPDTNYGLILRGDDPSIPYGGAVGYGFATAEYWQVASRPRLQVLVDVTMPAPASPTPTANPSCVAVYLETEAGVLGGGQFVVGTDSQCSGCQYVVVPDGTGNIGNGYVSLSFKAPAQGQYYFHAHTRAPDWQARFAVDNETPVTWPLPAVGGGWTWENVRDGAWVRVARTLSAGWHEFRILNYYDGAQFDALAVTTACNCAPVSRGCSTTLAARAAAAASGPAAVAAPPARASPRPSISRLGSATGTTPAATMP